MEYKEKRISLLKYERKDCPHCRTEFKRGLHPYIYSPNMSSDALISDMVAFSRVGTFGPIGYEMKAFVRAYRCPKCDRPIIDFLEFWTGPDGDEYSEPPRITHICPAREPDPLLSKHIPLAVRQDFIEAFRVRDISLKASATLARRCLQNTLRHAFPDMKAKKGWLWQEIEWVETNSNLDSDLIECLSALKEAGNFGAHPEKEGELQTIYELSPEDLGACFSVLEELFSECFIKPAEKKERRERLKQRFPKPEKKKATGIKK